MRKVIILLSFILAGIAVQAQDFHWSQIHLNPVYLNPAFTGFANKANRVTGIYRDQWRAIPVPYSTTHLSYDRKLFHNEAGWRMGLGAQLLYDKAGDGALSTIRPGINAAIGKYFNSSKQLVTLGVQGAWARKQLDFSKLTFDTQYDGVTYNPGLDPGEQIAGDNASYFDLGAGLNFQSKMGEKSLLDLGFSAFNLTRPSYNFLSGSTAEVGQRLMAYGKADIQLGQSQWQFNPGVYYQNQDKAQQTLLQSLFTVGLGKEVEGLKETKLSFGPGYRIGDAIVGYVGVIWKDLKVGFAFDGNVSDLRTATGGRGAYEVALNYEWEKKKKPEPKEFDDVPVEEEEEKEEPKKDEPEEEIGIVELPVEEPLLTDVKPISPVDPTVELEKLLTQFKTDLLMMQPVRLFFDNDQPNPKTRLTSTSVTYEQTVKAYSEAQAKYAGVVGEEADAFFDEQVQKGFNDLKATLLKTEALLKAGKKVNVELKGFASPLSNPAYNEPLSSRRISSVMNYLKTWNNGALSSYIESGQLSFTQMPLGDTKTNKGVSADAKDLKNAVYSPNAAFERRVELMFISIQ